MRILYLSPTGVLGGAEKVLLGVLRGVRQACPEVKLHLLAFAPGPLVERAADLGVDVEVLPLPAALEGLGDSQLTQAGGRMGKTLSLLCQLGAAGPAGWRFVQELRRQVGRIDPDLIHSNGIKTHGLIWLAHGGEIPVVWHVHDFFSARPLAWRLLRLAARRVAGVIAVSEAVGEDLRVLGLGECGRVIANAVEVDAFCPGPPQGRMLDELAGLAPASADCLRVGLIASYARWKGHKVFLEAAARFAQARPTAPIRFFIIGGPIYQTAGSQFQRRELQAFAANLGLDGRIGFIDFQTDVVPIYRGLDVVVHASTAPEPFGLTIIEAMACGKPVIASLAGGVRDVIEPGHDALGLPSGDVPALVDAMQWLLHDASRREVLGANARQTVCRRFNTDRVGPQVLDFYRSLIERSDSYCRSRPSARMAPCER